MAKLTAYEEFRFINVRRTNGVVRVVLDNPPMNSVEPPAHRELATIFRRIAEDAEARVAVLTGNGERAFCAGADLNRTKENFDDFALWTRQMAEQREIILSILECDKPIVCRINGHAMGVGASMAVACDITVMVDDANIADPHVKVGLVAGDGGAMLWPGLVGMARTRRYLLTGDSLSGREAADIGLVTEAVTREQLDPAVERWVAYFQTAAPVAIAGTKRAINSALRRQGQTDMDLHLGLETYSFMSNDYREAVQAFLEKRPPKFTGG